MHIPFVDLSSQYRQIADKIEQAVIGTLRSGQYILGPAVTELEAHAAEYLGVTDSIAVSSGTDALLMALMALEIGPGDEVIVPDFSFAATAMTVLRVGAIPVFVDIEPQTWTINVEEVKKKISPKTKAIIPVHLFGQTAHIEKLLEIGETYNLAIIEDAAQAFGAEDADGKKAGSRGTLGCFSFYPTKNLGAAGDAGLVTTNDAAIAERLRLIRNHGQKERYYSTCVGGNFRMDTIQAIVITAKLSKIDQWNRERRRIAQLYSTLFTNTGLCGSQDPAIRIPVERVQSPQCSFPHIYHQYVVAAKNRDSLRSYLTSCGIETQIYYPVPFHRQPVFQPYVSSQDDFPVADYASKSLLALPIYPGLAPEQIEHVVQCIRDFYQ